MGENSRRYRIDFVQAKKVFHHRTVQAADQEKPTIGIRVNDVIDSRGQLTGYLEVGLWVKTPTVYYDASGEAVTDVPDTVKPGDETTWADTTIASAKPQTFSSLGVSLKYNASILTSVAWEGRDEEGQPLSGKELEVQLVTGSQVNLPAKKADEGTTAAAAISHNPVTADTETNKTGMLYFMVEATNGEAVLPDGTLLGVVRFYYDGMHRTGDGDRAIVTYYDWNNVLIVRGAILGVLG